MAEMKMHEQEYAKDDRELYTKNERGDVAMSGVTVEKYNDNYGTVAILFARGDAHKLTHEMAVDLRDRLTAILGDGVESLIIGEDVEGEGIEYECQACGEWYDNKIDADECCTGTINCVVCMIK